MVRIEQYNLCYEIGIFAKQNQVHQQSLDELAYVNDISIRFSCTSTWGLEIFKKNINTSFGSIDTDSL